MQAPEAVHLHRIVEAITLCDAFHFVVAEHDAIDGDGHAAANLDYYALDLSYGSAEDQLHGLLAHVGEQVDAHAGAPSRASTNRMPLLA